MSGEVNGSGGPGAAEGFQVATIEDSALRAEAYVLRDLSTGSEARVLPSIGSNLYSLRVPIAGKPLEVLAQADGGEQPISMRRYGTPILFPFPNRVRGGRFSFGGREHQMDTEGEGNTLHGFVWPLPWRVQSASATPGGAVLATRMDSTDHPAVQAQFPFPFWITARFTLKGAGLRMELEAANAGDDPMPMGLGLHPWFRLPLAPEGCRQDCLIQLPAPCQWELGPTPLPTGRVLAVPPSRDFRRPRPLGDLALDDLYTGLSGPWNCRLVDPAAGAQLVLGADAAFREAVIFAPLRRGVICVEPYSCATDAFNLHSRGIDAGLVILEPGQSWRGAVEFRVSPP